MKKIFKLTFILLSPLFLGGCGDSAWGNAKHLIQKSYLYKKFKGIEEEPHIKREAVNNIPYATISAGWGKSDPAILVLGYVDNGDVLQWLSSNNRSLTTQYGRVIKTVGFDTDIAETIIEGEDPLKSNAHLISGGEKYSRTILFEGEDEELVTIDCEFFREGPERIVIAELEFETIRLKEKCTGVKWWTVKNVFWVDYEDGMVWKSRQELFYHGQKLEINTLKPFA